MLQRQQGAKVSKERSKRKLIELAIIVFVFSITSKNKKYRRVRRKVFKLDCMSIMMRNGIYRKELGKHYDRERAGKKELIKVGVGS